MKRTLICLLLLSLAFLSCDHGKKEKLLGEWVGSKYENPEMDNFFRETQKYIDTIGKNGDDATNLELYGVTNMDSIRHILQLQHDSAQTEQMRAVINTTFTFKRDSIALVSFMGNTNTSKWHIEHDTLLVMEALTGEEKGTIVNMTLLDVTDSELQLKIVQDSTYSKVTFKRSGK